MKYLLDYYESIYKKLLDKHILLFLDFDGTLAPIRKIPEKVNISNKNRRVLFELSKNPKFTISIISGRTINYLKKSVGLKNIIYSGNHGFQIEGNKIKHNVFISSKYKKILKLIETKLSKELNLIKGIYLENKNYGLSIHYRLTNKKNISLIKEILGKITKKYLFENKINIQSGKMVFEILPPINWDKGKAVLDILEKYQTILGNKNIYPIYIGDDTTDENAFKLLRKNGLTIFVGNKSDKFSAKYYLNNIKEVNDFLIFLLKIGSEKCQN